jgi:pimeloyl-ACP methyl ester carboxylesterase
MLDPEAPPMPAFRRLVSLVLAVAVVMTLAIPALHAEPVVLKTTELGHGPTLVFVHSMGLTRSDWLATARKLLSGFRVVLVDLPGHGDSPMPEPFTFATAGEALDAVLARQNPDSTIVIGHQMGGRVAMAALAAHPERARGLVLIDVPVGTPVPVPDQQKKMFLDYMDSQYEAVSKMMFSKLGRDTTQSQAIYAMYAQTQPATIKAYVREMFYSDGNRDAKALKLPVRMMLSSRALPDSLTAGRELKKMGWEDTTATVTRIPDSAMWIMKDQPDTLAARIREFAASAFATPRR